VVKNSGCGFRHEIIPVEEKTGVAPNLGLYHDLNVRYIKQRKRKIYFSGRDIYFYLQLMQDECFRSGDFNTKFLDGFTLK
jgi:hypothetical protein